MKLDLTISILYDTLRYYDIIFNQSEIEKRVNEHLLSLDICFDMYNKIQKINQTVNDIDDFWALFYYNGTPNSFIQRYFLRKIDLLHTLEDFVKIMQSREFENEFKAFYFPEKKCVHCRDAYTLDIDGNVKLSLYVMIQNFERMITEFIKSFYVVHQIVVELFNNNRSTLHNFSLDSESRKIIKDSYNDEITINSIYGISLLHPYAIRYGNRESDNKHIWILGYECKEALEKEYSYLHINPQSIGTIIGNKYHLDIISIMLTEKKINPASLTRILQEQYSVGESTVHRAINTLITNKVIYIAEKTSKNIYYSLNRFYFERAKIELDKTMMYYINNI